MPPRRTFRAVRAGPDDGADAAWATADTLHAAAAALGSRILRDAADAYDRAARAPYGRIPAPTLAGDSLRRAARLLSAFAFLTADPSFRPLVLITRLAALAEAIAGLRHSQQRAAQAASALSAAQRLRAAPVTPPAQRRHPHRRRTRRRGLPVMPGPVPGVPLPRRPADLPRLFPGRQPGPGASRAATSKETDIMDPSDVYPDLLGQGMSRSSQRLAQMGSLLASWAVVEARRKERRNAAKTARSQRELETLREQERAAYKLARAGWAPALDRKWLAQADLVQAARTWSAAAAYADADPGAAAAASRSEERLRTSIPTPWPGMTGCALREPGGSTRCARLSRCSPAHPTRVPAAPQQIAGTWQPPPPRKPQRKPPGRTTPCGSPGRSRTRPRRRSSADGRSSPGSRPSHRGTRVWAEPGRTGHGPGRDDHPVPRRDRPAGPRREPGADRRGR